MATWLLFVGDKLDMKDYYDKSRILKLVDSKETKQHKCRTTPIFVSTHTKGKIGCACTILFIDLVTLIAN